MPSAPGPLRWLDTGTEARRDDLDELIDELFPDTDEGPGWTDAVLVAGGASLLGWSAVGDAPAAVPWVGAAAAGLGCILPARGLWRWAARRRHGRRRAAVLAGGVPLRVGDPEVRLLVSAYEELLATVAGEPPASALPLVAAGHGAVMEVATLLRGGGAEGGAETEYVRRRSDAIAGLVAALRRPRPPRAPAGEGPAAAAVAEARDELDALDGTSSLRRLADLAAETERGDAGG